MPIGPVKRVVCTCRSSGCGGKAFRNEFGQEQPGQEVTPRIRSAHRLKDSLRDTGGLGGEPPLPHSAPISEPAGPRTTPPENRGTGDQGRRGVATEAAGIYGSTGSSLSSLGSTLSQTIHTFGAWIHHVCGLSRESTNRALKVVNHIVTLSISIGYMLASASAIPTHLRQPESFSRSLNLPTDVRTAVNRLSIDPVIQRSICCPACYARYEIEDLPARCTYRESPRSRPCDTILWTTRSTTGGVRVVPTRLYCTQDFESWLEFFLSRPGIEDYISKSYAHQPNPDKMESIWDSPAWQSLGSFTTTPGNLTFAFYIDWFNPFTNKIAGKTASCGAIIFTCLNLPYEIRHLPENTFFAGITPPPKEPTVITITALMDPVTGQFERMWSGKIICTFCHPEGVLKRVAVLPCIGDLLAIRKALGFAGIASDPNFCSFCKLHRRDIDDLDSSHYSPRIGTEVRAHSQLWTQAVTKKRKQELFKENGVRGSSLHALVYRDPVKHTVLGVMHNWYEGVLQFHARMVFGIGIPSSTKRAVIGGGEDIVKSDDEDSQGRLGESAMDVDVSPNSMEVDQEVLEDELQQIHAISSRTGEGPSHSQRVQLIISLARPTTSSLWTEDREDNDPISPDDANEFDDNNSDFEDAEYFAESACCIFDTFQMSQIHACIADAVVPSWVTRPPGNLGEKSHGKLKADQWLILFTVYFPLILPEMLSLVGEARYTSLLDNFYSLVTATNLISSHSTSPPEADLYQHHYTNYRKTLKELFPHINSRPNHHFAMHNGDLLKFWGPLVKLSENPYEQQNGMLQKINTNHHMWELDLTMLRNMCRRGRLLAFCGKNGLLEPEGCGGNPEIQGFSELEAAIYNSKGVVLSPSHYSLLLSRANMDSSLPIFRHFSNLPHPPNTIVYPRNAVEIPYLTIHERTYTSRGRHPGNSSVAFRHSSASGQVEVDAGFIERIYRQVIQGSLHTFIIVLPHKRLSPNDQHNSPYAKRPGFKAEVVYAERPAETQSVLIGVDDVVGHVALYRRPGGTFGIKQPTLVIVNSLHRDRQST